MAKLKELSEIIKTNKLKGTVKSGFKSGDSNAELVIADPLQEHPEIKGLYRAFDPDTGWKGWVEYTPPAVEPPIDTENKYRSALIKLKQAKVELDLGVISQAEYDVELQKVKDLRV